ncbi:MAG: site-2 protease family protein [Leptolyngbyaceae bacterium]|nr:site-2 protease family protein [Leptolyngbyaceae bacterium]
MKSGWRIGSIFNIPFFIDPSWFPVLLLFTFFYGSLWQSENWGTAAEWFAGFVMALLLFGSVVLHELGHSLVARSQGIHVKAITLFLFGGLASIEQESKTPEQAFQVAIAGPAVSLSLFLILSLLHRFLPLVVPIGAPAVEILETLAWINLVLAAFNMIPGLPLDGGQVLKAAIWKATGNRIKGVRWSARMGQALGWIAIALGVTLFITEGLNAAFLWISLIGWFGVRNAAAYQRVSNVQDALLSISAADAMTREYRVVDARSTVRKFVDDYVLEDAHPAMYYAASDGRYRGLVSINDVRDIERSVWDTQTLEDLAQPLETIPSVAESTSLATVIVKLEDEDLKHITVLSPAGAVSGVIDRGDTVQAISKRLGLQFADSLVRRIKEEGAYPPELQIAAIARSLYQEGKEEQEPKENV